MLAPERLQVTTREPFVRPRGSELVETVLMRAVQHLAGNHADDLRRIALLLSRIGDPGRPDAINFFGGKAWTERNISQQRERCRKIPAQTARRYGRRIARRAGG